MSISFQTFLGRRAFLQNGSLVLAALGVNLIPRDSLRADEESNKGGVVFGLITDLHHADKPSAGGRYYRETLGKLAEAARQFEKARPAFVVELGDLIDAADSVEAELGYLRRIDRDFSAIAPRRHYVLGNHCVSTLTKEEFLGGVGQGRSYYSFDEGGVHFVVLDACFRGDGAPYGRKNFEWTDANIPAAEVEWLRGDLRATDRPVIVFAHQRLDVANHYGVRNAAEVRRVLEESGRVRAVLQGHSHRNDYREIAGIHYVTLVAMVEGTGAENSGYSVMEVRPEGTIRLRGFRKQADYEWPVGRKPSG
jgi:3',5'-cyclic AMP phosphodiesterase CpdA